MFKKLSLIIIILAITVAYLGGIFSVTFSPFSLTVNMPEKDFLKKVVRKAEGIIYREATVHNPAGDLIPDRIDDSVKSEIKKIVN